MKKFIALLSALITLFSCQEEVKFNDPSFQTYKDDLLWRSGTTTATKNTLGKLTLTAEYNGEKMVLTTNATTVGTYALGTINTGNMATFWAENSRQYKTLSSPISGPANSVILINGGSGYTTSTNSVATRSTGLGFGLRLNYKNNSVGTITEVSISQFGNLPVTYESRGNAYSPGDIVTIDNGTGLGSASVMINNVLNSNGEIVITKYENGKISGTFQFNALETSNLLTVPDVLNCQKGIFYNIPVTSVQ